MTVNRLSVVDEVVLIVGVERIVAQAVCKSMLFLTLGNLRTVTNLAKRPYIELLGLIKFPLLSKSWRKSLSLKDPDLYGRPISRQYGPHKILSFAFMHCTCSLFVFIYRIHLYVRQGTLTTGALWLLIGAGCLGVCTCCWAPLSAVSAF